MLDKIAFVNEERVKKDVAILLETAFPENERPPTDFFFKNFEKENNKLIAFYQDGNFIGFTALTFYLDICYIFFLAVSPTFRNQGFGGQILEIIKKDYKDCVVLLAYEEVDTRYPNYPERKRRQEFYQKHGFKDNELVTDEWGVHFTTAYIGQRKVTFEEYKEIFKFGFGVNADKYLKKAR